MSSAEAPLLLGNSEENGLTASLHQSSSAAATNATTTTAATAVAVQQPALAEPCMDCDGRGFGHHLGSAVGTRHLHDALSMRCPLCDDCTTCMGMGFADAESPFSPVSTASTGRFAASHAATQAQARHSMHNRASPAGRMVCVSCNGKGWRHVGAEDAAHRGSKRLQRCQHCTDCLVCSGTGSAGNSLNSDWSSDPHLEGAVQPYPIDVLGDGDGDFTGFGSGYRPSMASKRRMAGRRHGPYLLLTRIRSLLCCCCSNSGSGGGFGKGRRAPLRHKGGIN